MEEVMENKTAELAKKIQRQTYTVEELSKVLGIGRRSAGKLCGQKGFPALKFGCQYKIPIAALEKWLLEQIQ